MTNCLSGVIIDLSMNRITIPPNNNEAPIIVSVL